MSGAFTSVPRSLFNFLLPLLLITTSPSLVSAVANCYYPDGTVALQVAPCSSEGGVCCPFQWQCLSNGLCANPAENYLGRYSCTDQTWQSSSCPQICTEKNTATGNEAVLKCADGSYCCDGNRSWDCCTTNGTSFFELAVGNVQTSITATYAPTTAKSVQNSPAPSSEGVPVSSKTSPTTSTTSKVSSKNPSSTTSPPSISSSPTSTVTSRTTSTNAEGGVVTITLISTAYPSSTPNSQTDSVYPQGKSSNNSSSENSTLIPALALGIPLALLLFIGAPLATYCILLRRRRRRNNMYTNEGTLLNGNNGDFNEKTGFLSSIFPSRKTTHTRLQNSNPGYIQAANYTNLAPGTHAPELDGWPVAVQEHHTVDEKRELGGSEPPTPVLMERNGNFPSAPSSAYSSSSGSNSPSAPSPIAVEAGGWSRSELAGSTPSAAAFGSHVSAQASQQATSVTMMRMPPPRFTFYGGVTGRRMPGIAEEAEDGAEGSPREQQQQQQQPVELWGGSVTRGTVKQQREQQRKRWSSESARRSAEEDEDDARGEAVVPREGV